MSQFDRYSTRKRANRSVKVFLVDPATGEPTDDYLEVVSSLSDKFRQARDAAFQEAGELAVQKEGKKKQAAIEESKLRLYASLVVGWNNDTECTTEAVMELFREAPQVQDMVVDVADSGERFFGNGSNSSENGSKPK